MKKFEEIAETYFNCSKFAPALENYNTLIAIYPEESRYVRRHLEISLKLKLFEEAYRSCCRLLEFDNEDTFALKSTALCLQNLGEFEKSNFYCQRYQQINRSDHEIREIQNINEKFIEKLHFFNENKEKNHEECLKMIDEILRTYSQSLTLKKMKLAPMLKESLKSTRKFCKSVIKEHGPIPEFIVKLVQNLLMEGKINEPIAYLRDSLYLYPDDVTFQTYQANTKKLKGIHKRFYENFSKKQYKSCISDLTEALFPNSEPVCFNIFIRKLRADCYYMMGEYLKSLEETAFILSKLGNDYFPTQKLRGKVLFNLGKKDEFIALFEHFSGIDPEDNEIVAMLNNCNNGIHIPRDFYEVLWASKEDSPEKLKSNYIMRMKRWAPVHHPHFDEEKCNEAKIMFERISFAYYILSDPDRKELFDDQGDLPGLFELDFEASSFFQTFFESLQNSECEIILASD